MSEPQEKPVTFETLNSTKLIIGAVVGVVVMYWAFNDRIATRTEAEVTLRVKTATTLARIEERLFACETALKASDATDRAQADRINGIYQQLGNRQNPLPTTPPAAAPANP